MCADLCGATAGQCDLTVKIASFKKDKCSPVKDKAGVYACSFTMVVSASSKWLNAMIHDPDAPGTDESKIPRNAEFKKAADGVWTISDAG